jgi:RNA polymerase subunit RPABC4/transcription elongation factor Spt4
MTVDVKKKECPSCAMDIDEDVAACPICGYEFSRSFGATRWVAIGLLILIIGYLIRQWIG